MQKQRISNMRPMIKRYMKSKCRPHSKLRRGELISYIMELCPDPNDVEFESQLQTLTIPQLKEGLVNWKKTLCKPPISKMKKANMQKFIIIHKPPRSSPRVAQKRKQANNLGNQIKRVRVTEVSPRVAQKRKQANNLGNQIKRVRVNGGS